MSTRVLLIGGNCWPEPTGIGKYNGEMIDWLNDKGFECRVITTYPYYPYWKVQEPFTKKRWRFSSEFRKNEFGNEIKITRCPHFVPKNPTGLKRMISDFTFFITSACVVAGLLFTKKYDYVITVAPPFQIGLLGVLYKKLRGAKFLYHIQDLQIDAGCELGMIKSGKLLKLLLKTEKFILHNADTISAISSGMIRKIKAKCNKEVLYFPNWADTKSLYPLEDKAIAKKKFGFKRTQKVVLYSGAVGEKQGLDAILYSAKQLEEFKDVTFVICGAGPYKEKLELLQQSLQLTNVMFSSIQDKETFNLFLNMADVHLVLQKGIASDLVMPSKLTAILSVGGLALVTANPDTTLYNLMTAKDLGIVAEPDNIEALSSAILFALENDMAFKSQNAREFALEHLSIDKILSKYTEEVLDLKDSRVLSLNAKKAMVESLNNKVLQASDL